VLVQRGTVQLLCILVCILLCYWICDVLYLYMKKKPEKDILYVTIQYITVVEYYSYSISYYYSTIFLSSLYYDGMTSRCILDKIAMIRCLLCNDTACPGVCYHYYAIPHLNICQSMDIITYMALDHLSLVHAYSFIDVPEFPIQYYV